MGTDKLTMRLIEQEFHKPIGVSHRQRLAARLKRELADLELEALLLGGALGETDAGHLRMAIGASGEGALTGGGALAEHALDGLDRLPASDVGEPWGADDVSGSIHAGDAGLVAIVDVEVTLGIQLVGCRAARKQRGDTNGNEGHVGREGFIGTSGNGDLDSILRGCGFLHLGAGKDPNPLLCQGLLECDGGLGVLDG